MLRGGTPPYTITYFPATIHFLKNDSEFDSEQAFVVECMC